MAQTQLDSEPDLVALAAKLRSLLARNAARAERDRRLPQENIEALEAANLFRLLVPRRWNGYGAPLTIALNAFVELAKGCASTSWVTMITCSAMWIASLLPDRGQEEVFADSIGLRTCAVISPSAKGQRVEGGLRVSGRLPYASGCWHASWALLGFEVEDHAHSAIDDVIGAVPISEIAIEDTWFVAGMRGTGSNTLVAKDLFIPEHRTLSTRRALNGDYPSQRYSGERSDRYAFAPVLAVVLLGPIVGTAKALLEAVLEGTQKRGIAFTSYARQADAAVIQHRAAEAALKIDSSSFHMMRAAADIDTAAADGRQMEYAMRARVHGDCGYAAMLAREAIDTLVSIGGASAFAEASPVQRMWRDANVASRHGLLTTDRDLEIYGRALLGVEGNITPVI